ncbi:hypothetical protein [uncultured Psychrobacter sp.]|uniref:hypothetical protein n=1 Tax=uncultured Psychrobacter sp. TaxID=259303 RepID=UPI003459CE5A
MKDKTLFISSVLIAFIFGSLTTYLLMTKKQMDQIMQAKQHSPVSSMSNNDQNTVNLADNLSSQAVNTQNQKNDSAAQVISNLQQSDTPSVNDYSQEQALALVNNMPDYVLSQYVDKFMARGASEVIADKRRFAERAVEELYKSNDNQPLAGTVKLSLNPVMPTTSVDTSTLNKNAKLFAHLDTAGKVPSSPFVFVKWVNNQTGQVLLFEKKDIVASRNQNWVSFSPYEGWEPGSYDIRFYQFTSELQPVAQLTYNIYTVEGSEQGRSKAGNIVNATATRNSN